MKYLILLVKHRKSQSSFLVVFLTFLLTSCGGEKNSFSTLSIKIKTELSNNPISNNPIANSPIANNPIANNPFKVIIDAKGVRVDFSSLQNITDITRITIDYSTDELREEFNRRVDTNIKNDNFSPSASFYTLPRVIIKDKPIKYSYFISVYRNNNLDYTQDGVFITLATQPPVIISGFDNITFDFASLENPENLERISIEYTTSTADQPKKYDSSVDTQNNDVTKDTSYILPNLTPGTTYYYRFTAYRGNFEQIDISDTVTKTIRPPNITSGFDNVTFDFASLDTPADIDRISIEYTASKAFADAKEYDLSVDSNKGNFSTSDNNYILRRVIDNTRYYYRFTVYRGKLEQVSTGDVATKMTHAPVITSDFDRITFDFTNLENPADIDRISIEYTTSKVFADAKEYDLSVDSSKGDFSTSANNYILKRVIDNTRYYYRFTAYRGLAQQVLTGDVATKMTRAPVITSGFDNVTFDFTSLENPADINRISIEYTTSQASADVEEYDFSVDSNKGNFSTSANNYILRRVIDNTRYYYRFTAYRGLAQQVSTGDVATKMTNAPVITSDFDSITFDFTSLENLADIDRISIEYTTSKVFADAKEYDFSVDSNKGNFSTSTNNYILRRVIDNTHYYYRFTAYRGLAQQVSTGDVATKMTSAPVITSDFDSITFDFTSLENLADIDRISIEYTTSKVFADAKEYDFSVDSNKGNFSTSTNNYILRRVIDNTHYYYRFTAYRGLAQQVSTGDVATKMTSAPVITSDFDNITFDFASLENPADIDRISIEYNTSKVFADAKEYDFSVDSNKGDFSTSDNNYILKRVIDNTRYYYRFTAYRGLAQQVLTGDVATKMTRAPVITSGFDSITFDFTSLENLADIDRISIEYTTSKASADAKEYDFSVDTRHNDVTKDTPYILPNLTPGTTYHYRIVVKRGEARQVVIDNFSTFPVDRNGNGLIEISTLTQLHNIRYNLKGTSYKTDDSDASSTSGCPRGVCRGYELTKSLDFDKNNSGSTWSTSDNKGTIKYTLDQGDNVEPYFVVDSGGWEPIGEEQLVAGSSSTIYTCDDNGNNTCFDAVFEGNGNTISSLAMRRDLQYLGMFGVTGASADIRNLGLLANLADYTGASNDAIYIGGLVGRQHRGNIAASYTKGNVAGGAGNDDRVGGLVGLQDGGSITASYATGKIAGEAGNDRVGGLVGSKFGGRITASYATGAVAGGDGTSDQVGGLVGHSSGSITASYATGAVAGGAGGKYVGGLVGYQFGGKITVSYATGAVAGGARGDYVGGLVGHSTASITASYATGVVDGGAGGDRMGGLVGYQFGGKITASYATGVVDGGVGGDDVGGLVGWQYGGRITASYATGVVDGGAGGDEVGGLVGYTFYGIITAGYATGKIDGGAGDDFVGGLAGYQFHGGITTSYATGAAVGGAGSDRVGVVVGFETGGSITASYGFGTVSGENKNNYGSKPSRVNTINDLTLSNAGASWNSATTNTSRAWNFGTTNQPPALKYADYDGSTGGKKFACEGAGNTTTDANTIYLPYCVTFLPGQGRSPVGGNSATGTSITLGNFALVDNDFDGYIEISNLVALGNIIYNPQGTSYKTSTASTGITSGCPRGVCRGYELTRSFSTTELESGGVAHYLINILTQDVVIKSNGYSIADIYLPE